MFEASITESTSRRNNYAISQYLAESTVYQLQRSILNVGSFLNLLVNISRTAPVNHSHPKIVQFIEPEIYICVDVSMWIWRFFTLLSSFDIELGKYFWFRLHICSGIGECRAIRVELCLWVSETKLEITGENWRVSKASKASKASKVGWKEGWKEEGWLEDEKRKGKRIFTSHAFWNEDNPSLLCLAKHSYFSSSSSSLSPNENSIAYSEFLKPMKKWLRGRTFSLYHDGLLGSDIYHHAAFFSLVLIGIYSECLADDVGLFLWVFTLKMENNTKCYGKDGASAVSGEWAFIPVTWQSPLDLYRS